MVKQILKLGTVLLIVVVWALVLSYPTMLLWNGCLVGAVNGVNPITWLQALGLIALVKFMGMGSSDSKD